VFRNVGIYNSDAGELPKRKHNIFRTRRKFEIKNSEEMLFWQCAVMEYFVKEESLPHISTHGFSVHMEVPAWTLNPNWLPANCLYKDKQRKNQIVF